jgi:type I restriction enzyme M protein
VETVVNPKCRYFCRRDESLKESDNLPVPDLVAQKMVEDLEATLEQFREIAGV